MPNTTTPQDRTGHKIEPVDSLVVIEVIAKVEGANIYVLQDHIKTDPDKKTGAYFVTGEQLESMIMAYETGEWGYEL
ncbi:MAG: hypothetical protein V3V74_06745 [Nitrosomonadaceae bacterium]